LDETDDELLARWRRVSGELKKAIKLRDRTQFGCNRDRKSRWCGSLNFTLLGIESELRCRGLKTPA
jgi:hypothetical protein